MATSSWRLEDLQELEQYGLAADLASANLSVPDGGPEAYNMTEVLSNLLDPYTTAPHAAHLPMAQAHDVERFCVFLKAPTSHGSKAGHSPLTYLNQGQHYELELRDNSPSGANDDNILYKSVVSLGFQELRHRNCEPEQLGQWGTDHPMERMLEIDKVGCGGVVDMENDENCINTIVFVWRPDSSATLAFRINCLSSEFSAKKHGGERGVLLQLKLDTFVLNRAVGTETQVHSAACGVKVFKDKGGDRKQRQDLQKIEKLSKAQQATLVPSQPVSYFTETLLPLLNHTSSPPSVPTGSAQRTLPSAVSPFTSPMSSGASQLTNHTHDGTITVTSSVQQTRDWLVENRFTPYLSLFANYVGADLLRLSRRDLVELCSPADGIRLYNALRSRTVRTLYVCLESRRVYHAICLEQLTALELKEKLSSKLSLLPAAITSLLRLTTAGVPVLVDDVVVQHMQDEEAFTLHSEKGDGTDGYTVVLASHTPSEGVSVSGATPRTHIEQ